MRALRTSIAVLLAAGAAVVSADAGWAQDKVRVGVFPVSSSLPLFVAIDKGFFKEANLDVETTRLIGGPPNVAALIQNQIDASAVLVTIEGMNANLKKDGVAMYISVNAQNAKYQMEQFVVRPDLKISSLADLKGKKIMSAPGPANVQMAKAALAAAGLKEGDYQIDQLDMGQHVNAMTAKTFDRRLHARAQRLGDAKEPGWPPRSRQASSLNTCWAIPTPTPGSAGARCRASSSSRSPTSPSASRRPGKRR